MSELLRFNRRVAFVRPPPRPASFKPHACAPGNCFQWRPVTYWCYFRRQHVTCWYPRKLQLRRPAAAIWCRRRQQLLQKENSEEEFTVDYARLTSFLEVDDSFLSPWSWNADESSEDGGSSHEENRYMEFQPESFFSNEVFDVAQKTFEMKQESPSDS